MRINSKSLRSVGTQSVPSAAVNGIAFDLSRLFTGTVSSTPRGIDRVDLAYARHFYEQWRGDCFGVLPTPWGIRFFSRERSLRVVNFIEDFWCENTDANVDPRYQWVKSRLTGQQPHPLPASDHSGGVRFVQGFFSFARQHGLVIGQPIRSLPQRTAYLNTGQVALAVPQLLSWIAKRQDIKAVFMLQDVIPIEYPEYCSPRLIRFHRQMLATTARYATALILTTLAARNAIQRELGKLRELAKLSLKEIAVFAAPLPVPPPFLKSTTSDPDLRRIPYFLMTGAIEPRKNHLLLLNIWCELVHECGPTSPKLLVVGSRPGASNLITDMLDRCDIIRDYIVEINGLPTPALRKLLAGARALLMPSFAEGFGMPIIEALAVGTPVIASDLLAHQETGGSQVTYLSPIDGCGWLSAIKAHVDRAPGDRDSQPGAPDHLWNSADYFRRIEAFVCSL